MENQQSDGGNLSKHGRLIDADKLKRHYAWWEDGESSKERKELFDTIIDLQPTVLEANYDT